MSVLELKWNIWTRVLSQNKICVLVLVRVSPSWFNSYIHKLVRIFYSAKNTGTDVLFLKSGKVLPPVYPSVRTSYNNASGYSLLLFLYKFIHPKTTCVLVTITRYVKTKLMLIISQDCYMYLPFHIHHYLVVYVSDICRSYIWIYELDYARVCSMFYIWWC